MSVTAPVTTTTYKIQSEKFPQYLFEYHPISKKVYLIVIPGKWIDGHFEPSLTEMTAQGKLIPINCETPAQFKGMVDSFFLGFRLGEAHAKGTEPHGT
jgi:hypothetical protein